jgi:hypothetical protein
MIDINDLYVNIPIIYTLNAANKLLKNNHVDKCIIKETMSTLKMIMNQNYFQYDDKFYTPKSGVAMGSLQLSTMAEIFLQDLEHNRIKHLLEGGKIIYYNRYGDGIFIIHNQTKITPQSIF